MPIPDYQSIMLPLLKAISDRKEHTLRSLVDRMAEHFDLADDERHELLPSGRQSRFYNRVVWASTYMRRAGLMKLLRRGVVTISDRGMQELDSGITRINVAFLRKYPEFVEFQTSKRDVGDASVLPVVEDASTPEETLGRAYKELRSALAQELLGEVRKMDWKDFEDLVVLLLVRMGYGGTSDDVRHAFGKRTSDEGIDGTIKEDKLGLGTIHVQAKRWKDGSTVGRSELQKFVGALAGQGARKGVFITASSFSKEARDYAPKNETKIVLLDGEQLVELMIDYDLGVIPRETFVVKRIDGDFFGEE